MARTKKVMSSKAKCLDWNSSELSSMIEEASDAFQVSVVDPRFDSPVVRRYIHRTRDDELWKQCVSTELSNRNSTCAKLLKSYKAATLDEKVYLEKVRTLQNYWSLTPPFEDDVAIITGSGRAISEAFNVLGALCFLGQPKPPLPEERAKFPYVCSLKWALQQQNSFGQSDTIEGISRAYEIRKFYRTLLIQEFSLAMLNPRIQQALLYLLQDRESSGLLTLMHISDYQPELADDSPLIDYFKTRCKIV